MSDQRSADALANERGLSAATDPVEAARSVVGPASCDDHRAHTIGCLDCAAAVCASDDYGLGEFLDLMEHIRWPEESTVAADQNCPLCDEFHSDRPRLLAKHLAATHAGFSARGGGLVSMGEPTPLTNESCSGRVFGLIDAELARLDERGDLIPAWRFNFLRRRWLQGVYVAREVAAEKLREIRAAYAADCLTRESEALGLYDDPFAGGESCTSP